jgi:V8-like Glu-specific endopeptidase
MASGPGCFIDPRAPRLPRETTALIGEDVEQPRSPTRTNMKSTAGQVLEPQLAGGQPTAPGGGSQNLEATALPDDRAFLDVVAVGDASSFHCTGIAITADAVLTAAHCLPATQVALAVRTTEVLRTTRVRKRFTVVSN